MLVASAAAATRHAALLQQTVDVLRRTGDGVSAAEHDVSR